MGALGCPYAQRRSPTRKYTISDRLPGIGYPAHSVHIDVVQCKHQQITITQPGPSESIAYFTCCSGFSKCHPAKDNYEQQILENSLAEF